MKATDIINNARSCNNLELMLSDGTWHPAAIHAWKYDVDRHEFTGHVEVSWYGDGGCSQGKVTLSWAQAEVLLRPSFKGRTLRVDEIDELEKKWSVPSDDMRALKALCETARGCAKEREDSQRRFDAASKELTAVRAERDIANTRINNLVRDASDATARANNLIFERDDARRERDVARRDRDTAQEQVRQYAMDLRTFASKYVKVPG